jgi:riboflavin kinase/FMN adenylyltransferase
MLGVFDGLHRGHVSLLRHAQEIAARRASPVVMTTFHPHPALVAGRARDVTPLLSLARRAETAAHLGADATLVVPFDRAVSRLSAADFVTRLLVDGLAAHAVVVGEDFRFGRGATGDVNLLVELGRRHGFAVSALPRVPGCSSSAVRKLLHEGLVDRAADVLGRPHRVHGSADHGSIRIEDGMVPAPGAYLVEVDTTPVDAVLYGRTLETLGHHAVGLVAVDFVRRA